MHAEYYSRDSTTHVDGTPIFQTDTDRSNERDVAYMLEDAWQCEVKSFGRLSPVDWYFTRHGRLIGIGELKSRSHAVGEFTTVWLNVRKWMSLSVAAVGLGVPAVFVVRFTDGVMWVPLSEIDGSVHRIAGCHKRVKSGTDIEPVIEVAIDKMRSLEAI